MLTISPSLSRVETIQYFETLSDKLDDLEGKIVLFGDLNLEKGRAVHYKNDEYELIKKFILSKSLTNLVTGPTHFNKIGKSYNQLDYAFANCKGVSSKIIEGFPGVGELGKDFDHAGIEISVNIVFSVVDVPARHLRKTDQISSEQISAIKSQIQDKIIQADLTVEHALLEMELAQIELEELLFNSRFIKSHKRIRGCSIQVSNEIFNVSGSFSDIEHGIGEKLKIDLARRIKTHLTTKSFGSRIMGIFNLGAKKATTLKCNLDPEEFRREIREAELTVDHSQHPERAAVLSHLLKKFESESEIDLAVAKLQSKWHDKVLFMPEFWKHIARKILTPYDQGVRPYAVVKTVIKSKEKLDQTSGWRLVWKATSPYEKGYDLLRSRTVQAHLLNNDAYCASRSTQKTLANVSNWEIKPGFGLLER